MCELHAYNEVVGKSSEILWLSSSIVVLLDAIGIRITLFHEMETHRIPVLSGSQTAGAVDESAAAACLAPFWPFSSRKHC